MVSVFIQTLGCKLNQIESEAIAEAFSREGFSVNAGDTADILVINTCTVTSKSEQKARRLIRKALKDNPYSCVIVTGCYAQMEARAIAALNEDEQSFRRLFVLTGGRKTLLLDLPRFLRGELNPAALSQVLERYITTLETAPGTISDTFRFNVRDFSFHSRPSLKIQDGCDRTCSYCRVTFARGPSLSLDAPTLLSRLRELEAAGHGEAVLTGVNLNQYQSAALDLGNLLKYLLTNTRTIALRLSSLEPEGMTESLLQVLVNKRIRPHFHLSVQSGSLLILDRMRRNYGPEEVETAVRRLRSLREDPFLACDIIAGFPGETPGEFAKTQELCRRIGFAWIHAFPYSRRPGTEAWNFQDSVPEREAVSRVESLINMARQGKAAYISRWAGKTVEAIVENSRGNAAAAALSENYLKLRVPLTEGQGLPPGTVIRCRIQEPLELIDPYFDAVAELKSGLPPLRGIPGN
jgi:threonylcarbamoyladenosine tRNA methylthiotransferase MtaB